MPMQWYGPFSDQKNLQNWISLSNTVHISSELGIVTTERNEKFFPLISAGKTAINALLVTFPSPEYVTINYIVLLFWAHGNDPSKKVKINSPLSTSHTKYATINTLLSNDPIPKN